ncbi:amidohydrolase family protein [Micrococcaceae bacterium Sec5.7]
MDRVHRGRGHLGPRHGRADGAASALPNMYIATTRKSALDPSLPANIPAYALGLGDALCHATRDAAFSCGMERDMGRLAAGLYADFVVLDADPFAAGLESLLTTSVSMTVVGGQRRYVA